jgi:parallel beta-helix repeat protein
MKNLTNAYSVRITFRFILLILLILLLTSNITIVGGETTNSEDNINKQIQDENIDDKISDYAEQDYSGIYYLHDDLPEHGQDIGNTHDVGDLQREKPHGYEERYCAKWVQFDFDEHVFGETTGDESFTILHIYYHIWWKSANEKADIGVELHGLYDSSTEFSYSTSHKDAVSTMEKNGYWLTTGLQEVHYFEEDIHDMAIKVVSIDAIPSVYSGIDQYSFIILNPDDPKILKSDDKDNDGINDYDELFVSFTNPEDKDTDNDGLNDLEEITEGTDGYVTDPNNFDMDIDELLDGEDPDPLNTQYSLVDKDWIIKDETIIKNDGLLVNKDIIVKNGGKLTLENTILKMNQNGEQNKIRVEKGGELIILNSHLITDDPDHWYSRTLQTEHWHNERTFEIYGKATIKNNLIDYGCMIYIRESNNTVIEDNEISHYYYGIFCSYSAPIIHGNTILPFIGNGVFLWHSSPSITDTEIRTYIGTGISCYYSAPIIRDCKISGGSNDFYLNGNSHPVVANTEFNSSMVHINDANSSLYIGSFEPETSQNLDKEDIKSSNNNYFELGVVILIIISIILSYLQVSNIFKFSEIKRKLFSNDESKKKKPDNKKHRNKGGKNNRNRKNRRNKNRNRNNRKTRNNR